MPNVLNLAITSDDKILCVFRMRNPKAYKYLDKSEFIRCRVVG